MSDLEGYGKIYESTYWGVGRDNSIGWGIVYKDLGADSTDADYQSVLNRSTALGYTAPSASQQTLQNTLVTDLKTAGVWDKLDMLFVFANDGSEEYSLIDWKNPTGTLATAYSAIAWASNTGFTGDGVADYIDTGHVAGTTGAGGETPQFTANDASMGIYSKTEYSSGAGNDYPISSDVGTQRIRFFETSSGGNRFLTTGSFVGEIITGASQRGMMGIQKNASGSIQPLAGDKTIGTAQTGFSDAAPTSGSVKIFRYSASYGEGNIKLTWVGSKFSLTEWQEYVTAVDTYIAAL